MTLRMVNGSVEEDHTPGQITFFDHFKRKQKDPVLMIKFSYTGQRSEFSRKATDLDKREYPGAWKRYKAGVAPETQGHSLKDLKSGNIAFIQDCFELGIHTVEELAAFTNFEDLQRTTEEPLDHLENLHKEARIFVKVIEELDNEQAHDSESNLTA